MPIIQREVYDTLPRIRDVTNGQLLYGDTNGVLTPIDIPGDWTSVDYVLGIDTGLPTWIVNTGGGGGGSDQLFDGNGSPEGSVDSAIGAMYIQHDYVPGFSPLWARTDSPAYTEVAEDYFNGSNDTDIDSRNFDGGAAGGAPSGTGTWSKNSAYSSGRIDVVSSVAVSGVSGDSLYTVSGLSLPSADYAVRAKILRTGTATDVWVGAGARMSSTQHTGYDLQFNIAAGYIFLYRIDNGSYTELGEAFVGTILGYVLSTTVIEIRCIGSTIQGLYNGTVVIEATDSTYTATGRPSLYMFGTGTSQYNVPEFLVRSIDNSVINEGWRTWAGFTGSYSGSLQIGDNCIASGYNSISVGTRVATFSSILGGGNAAVGIGEDLDVFINGVGIGSGGQVGRECVGIGTFANAVGTASIAIGAFANAWGNDSIAIGDSVEVDGDSAIGIGSNQFGDSSHADIVLIGGGISSTQSNEVSITGYRTHWFAKFWFGEQDRQNSTTSYSGRTTKMNDVTFKLGRAGSGSTASAWTNLAGGDWIFEGSCGTGTGTLGKIKFKTAIAGGTSTTVQTLVDTLTMSSTGVLFPRGYLRDGKTKTTTYTAAIGDEILLADATSASFTITLPPVASSSGMYLIVKKIDSSINTVTVDGNASETIDGATTLVIVTQYQTTHIFCNGSAWYIV